MWSDRIIFYWGGFKKWMLSPLLNKNPRLSLGASQSQSAAASEPSAGEDGPRLWRASRPRCFLFSFRFFFLWKRMDGRSLITWSKAFTSPRFGSVMESWKSSEIPPVHCAFIHLPLSASWATYEATPVLTEGGKCFKRDKGKRKPPHQQ